VVARIYIDDTLGDHIDSYGNAEKSHAMSLFKTLEKQVSHSPFYLAP
jgi:hypothetical protein